MQITLQIQNGNQNSSKTINGYTKEFESEILKENEAVMKTYKNGKIKSDKTDEASEEKDAA